MKVFLLSIPILLFSINSTYAQNKEAIKNEIFQTEKAFEQMTADKGIADAFYYFADENAVILRENDTLISEKDNIKAYYAKKNLVNASVTWTPDFIEVSDCGTFGYTYGKYTWSIKNEDGKVTEFKGVFHTVWKKQSDGNWKYVWD